MAEFTVPEYAETRAVDYNVTGRRIVAAIIDVVLLSLLYLLIIAAFGNVETANEDGGRSFEASLGAGAALFYIVAVFGYYILFEGLIGSTIGKLALGLRVVTPEGRPCGLGKAVLRNVLRIIDGLPFLYVVGLVAVAVTSKNQRIGDLAASTVVARA